MAHLRPKIIVILEIIGLSLLCVGLKFLTAYLNWEITYSSILPTLISSTIFFLGFILNGVLIDYKEAERIPDEVAVSIDVIVDQCLFTYKRTGKRICLDFISELEDFIDTLDLWFKKTLHTRVIMLKLHGFSNYILKIEKLTQPVFINRIKQESSNLRRLLLRAYSIRETQFLGSSHLITSISIIFVLINLILTKYNSTFESVLYVFGFSSIFIFIFKLVYDLDNPFDYYSPLSKYKDAVSLHSIYELKQRINSELTSLKAKKTR